MLTELMDQVLRDQRPTRLIPCPAIPAHPFWRTVHALGVTPQRDRGGACPYNHKQSVRKRRRNHKQRRVACALRVNHGIIL